MGLQEYTSLTDAALTGKFDSFPSTTNLSVVKYTHGYTYERIFSGVDCALLNFSSSCPSPAVAYLVDFDAFNQTWYTFPNASLYSNGDPHAPGLVPDSVCSTSCTNRLIGLNSTATYVLAIGYTGTAACNVSFALSAQIPGAGGEWASLPCAIELYQPLLCKRAPTVA